MVIRRRDYRELCQRVSDLESTVSELSANTRQRFNEAETATDEKLMAFASSIGDIQDGMRDFEEYREQDEEDRKKQRAFFDGFNNIMGYGVQNGQS